jgi:ParB-like chromosome segregation protein Spo0J
MPDDPAQWPADHVERWPIDRLIPYARNARTHSDAQISQIAASIREWGWTMPVLVDEAGTLIAGHGRVLAANQLGLPSVPTMTARGWSDAMIRAYRVADNKLALNSDWDDDFLRIELADLRGADFGLDVLGFTDKELAGLLVESLEQLPALPNGERNPFQQMTFLLHDDQVEVVKQAVQAAKETASFDDSPNENINGNALAHICASFIASRAA